MKRIFICIVSLLMLSLPLAAEVPHLINYQGILTDDTGTPLDGTYDITFNIYVDSLTMTTLWTESHTGIAIDEGLFSLLLGSRNPLWKSLFVGTERWLGVTVEPDPELGPRMRMTSVPWAMRAAVADTAGSVEWGMIASMPAGFADGIDDVGGSDNDWTIVDNTMYSAVTGRVGIGTTTPTHKLHVTGHIRSDDFVVADRFSASTGQALAREVDNDQVRISGGRELVFAPDRIKGSGIVLEGRDLGGTDAGGSLSLYAMDSHSIRLRHVSKDGLETARMIVDGSGNVGIGTTSPTTKLEVAGTIHSTTDGFMFPDGTVQTTADIGGDGLSLPFYDSTTVIKDAFIIVNGDTRGSAIRGWNSSHNTSGYLGYYGYGVYGYGLKAGVRGGVENGNSGLLGADTVGVYGEAVTTDGRGVIGKNLSYSGTGYGVYGESNTGFGVYGKRWLNWGGLGGSSYGIYGVGGGATCSGVIGRGPASGVSGYHDFTGNYGDLGTEQYGVFGEANGNYDFGVRGESTDGTGVSGVSDNDTGVKGNGFWGVYGIGSEIGVNGWGDTGVKGEGTVGVYGSGSWIGVYGYCVDGYAGYFLEDVMIAGSISKGAGSFLIDHPLDPENKLLRHNFIESPENLLIYRGKQSLDARGEATVEMPEYFKALTKEDEATVTLTSVGKPFMTGYDWYPDFSRFKLYGEPNREVSWVVYADRDDPVIRQLAMPVEEMKGPDNKACDRGELLYPVAYGYPENMGTNFKIREEMKQAERKQAERKQVDDPMRRN